MNSLRNEKGIALVTSLMLTLISLTIILSLLYLVNERTRVSASQKRYLSSLDAGYGGVYFNTMELLPRLITNSVDKTLTTTVLNSVTGSYPGGLDIEFPSGSACLQSKLGETTGAWTGCGSNSTATDPKVAPDITMTLSGQSGQSGYNVYTKIIDTQPGNTDTSGLDLMTGGVVASLDVINPGQPVPYLYTLEVQSEKEVNPDERARLSVLYAY